MYMKYNNPQISTMMSADYLLIKVMKNIYPKEHYFGSI